MPWAKIKFFWKSMPGKEGSGLWASSTRAGFDVSSIYNMMETNMWTADTAAGPHYITCDAGEGKETKADYLAVSGHNLGSLGALVSLQYSADGQGYTDALAPFTPSTDSSFVKEFANPGAYRFWRIKIDNTPSAPYLTVCIWGESTELDYATASFDPHEQETKSSVNVSQGGYLAGAHAHYTERSLSFRIEDAGEALYEKIREWREGNGLKNFFVMWEPAGHPEEVFLMRPEPRFSNPLKAGGSRRDIFINLKGRKE